jgi:hypothetical protein
VLEILDVLDFTQIEYLFLRPPYRGKPVERRRRKAIGPKVHEVNHGSQLPEKAMSSRQALIW